MPTGRGESGSTRTPAGSGQPDSKAILQELVSLRQYSGVSILRILELAPELQRLPATHFELRRRGLQPGDEPVAAYYTLKCAVDFWVPRPDLHRVLIRSLNFSQEESSLTKRREDLQAEFCWSKKAYERLEAEAYLQLAGRLVSAILSPCDDEKVLDEPISFDFRLTVDRADQLQFLLTLLSGERRPSVVDAVSQRVLAMLPRGRSAANYHSAAELNRASAECRFLLACVMLDINFGDAARQELTHEDRLNWQVTTDLLVAGMQWDESIHYSLLAQGVDAQRPVDANWPFASAGDWPTTDFYRRVAKSIELIAHQLLLREDGGRWERVIRTNAAAASALLR